MTCKDCTHYDVCNMYDGPYISVHPNHVCKYFTDKQLMISLPCKVGEEIYVLNRGNVPQRMILDEPDIRCHCPKEAKSCMAVCDDIKHNICTYRLKSDGSDIGESVFLTKEAAEVKGVRK